MIRYLSLRNGSLLVNLDDSLRLRDLYFPYAGQETTSRVESIGSEE